MQVDCPEIDSDLKMLKKQLEFQHMWILRKKRCC